ncbi:MAG: hypothetical protein HQM00_09780 [Magnetococcales bacterium]|nr:hypothetical protein [Magnetococcales bacterium]
MNAEQIRNRLLTRNPLASVAASPPWETRLVDVPEINRLPFEGITRLLGQIAQEPGEPLAALVLGEVGNGKSHLVSRLRIACQHGSWPGEFALVTPPESGTMPYRYLLRELADSLRHPLEGMEMLSAWHRLAALLIAEGPDPAASRSKKAKAVEKILKTMQQRKKIPARWWKKLRDAPFLDRMPPLTHDLLEILIRWMPGSPVARREAFSWLRGEVRACDLLPARLDRSSSSAEALEEQAQGLLMALGAILARFHRPLLICFDRMEDLRTPGQNAAMDLMLTFLVDRMAATLPVVFARGQFWEELRLERWNAQTVGRMESNRFEMTGCSRAEAESLVCGRLEAVLGREGMETLYFDPVSLLETLPPGRNSPRVVLTLANRALQKVFDLPRQRAEESPESRLAEVWESLLTRLHDRIQDEPMRPERLLQVLRLYFVGDSGSSPEGETGSRLELSSGIDHPARLWLVEPIFHPKAVIHALMQGENWLRRHPGGIATYVRDGRHPIPSLPKWPETNHMIQRFQGHGGRWLELPPERVMRWHALGALHDAVRCGEITWMDRQYREQAVSIQVLIDFLHQHFAA